MNQSDRAARFAALHTGGPLLIFNAWDAGSAKAIVGAGAKAVATSSWSVAEAQGHSDGEDMPIDFAERIIGRIAASVDVPVSADFEGGYSDDDAQLERNAARFVDLGVVGMNFEDRVVKGTGLYDAARQARRIAVIRAAAQRAGVDLFINARSDVFFGQGADPAVVVDDALERARAYADAGASGFFIPGLQDPTLIGRICEEATLPVNVMIMDGMPSVDELTALGVARISWGPVPYLQAMAALQADAKALFAGTS